MSEPESTQLKKRIAELSKLFDGIDRVANSQAAEVAEPDPLAVIGEQDLSKDYPDELSSVQAERDAAEIQHLHEDVRQSRRINWTRIVVLTSLFLLIVLWIVSVMALAAACGFHWRGFALSDKVIITYITSTTASVLGLFIIAAKWLFSDQSSPNQARQQYPQSPKADPKRKRP
jgi:hypothetical protein